MAVVILAGLSALPAAAQVITDDFNDGNDAGWTRVDPRAGTPNAATFSFPNGGYRIQAPADAGTVIPRIGSFRTDATYTDFRVEADILDWDPNTIPGISVMARANLNSPGQVTGYVLTAAPGPIVQGQTAGSLVIQRYDPDFTDHSGSGNALFTAGNDYRLRFHGSGSGMAGELIDLSDGHTVLTAFYNDATYASGVSGLMVQDSGNHLPVDVTFDNYLSTVPEPTAGALVLAGALLVLRRRRHDPA